MSISQQNVSQLAIGPSYTWDTTGKQWECVKTRHSHKPNLANHNGWLR